MLLNYVHCTGKTSSRHGLAKTSLSAAAGLPDPGKPSLPLRQKPRPLWELPRPQFFSPLPHLCTQFLQCFIEKSHILQLVVEPNRYFFHRTFLKKHFVLKNVTFKGTAA